VGLVVLIISSFLALVTELTGRLMSALGVVLAVIYTFICHKDKLLK